jgi:putative copper export protein
VLDVTVNDVRLFLHMLAATVWVGGQLVLAALVPVLRRVAADAPAAAARQFARVAWPAFAVLIVTGVWNLAAVHRTDASYRTTLAIKLVVVALSGVTAYAHARATTVRPRAVFGALTGVTALAALFLGIVLHH